MSNERFVLPVNEQVELTELYPSDKQEAVRLLNDAYIYDRTLRVPSPYLEADFDYFLDLIATEKQKLQEPVNFAIRLKSGRLIGGCGYNQLTPGHQAILGYWLAKEYRGAGIMTDAVKALCQHAVNRWKVVRVEAHVFVGNEPSARVLEKNGFLLEGTMRKCQLKDGKFIDEYLYAWVS